jgi:hypothetical protein
VAKSKDADADVTHPARPKTPAAKKVLWLSSVVESLKAQAAIWFVGFVISLLAIFSSNITESIKSSLNRADVRSKYYEELAQNLSDFDFEAELAVEYIGNGLTEAEGLIPLINEYNESITTLRKKEYVYLSWVNRFWGKSGLADLERSYDAVKSFDSAIHSLNGEFEAVNIKKTQQKVDPKKAEDALVRLRPALADFQERSKKLLLELQ